MIVTVTLNAAIDRTLTVPNFQRGQRHRASAGVTLAGGKGINVARALKTLGVPVVATGLVGGADRHADRRAADRARRSSTTSCASTASRGRRPPSSIRPAAPTPRSTSGARRCAPRSSRCCSRSSRYLTQGAELVVFAGSLPRDVDDDFYAEAIRELARRHVPAVLDTEGEPLRLGVEAEPFLVSPNQSEAEALVGQEFHDDEDFRHRARDRSPRWAPRNVLITTEPGCVALLREEREAAAVPRRSRRASSRCRRSAPATSCSPAISPRATRAATHEESLRAAVAAGAASTLEVGAGPLRPAPGRPAAGRRRALRARARPGLTSRLALIRRRRYRFPDGRRESRPRPG